VKSGAQIVVLSTDRSGCGIWLCSGPGAPPVTGLMAVPELAENGEYRVLTLAGELTYWPLATLPTLVPFGISPLATFWTATCLSASCFSPSGCERLSVPLNDAGSVPLAVVPATEADSGRQDENKRSGQEREEPLPHVSPLVEW
jgi:hypothetical protein